MRVRSTETEGQESKSLTGTSLKIFIKKHQIRCALQQLFSENVYKIHHEASVVELIFSNSVLTCQKCALSQVNFHNIIGTDPFMNTYHWVNLSI